MPNPILGDPVWQPSDASQTARDAAHHPTYLARSCGGCGAGPLEACDRACPRTDGAGMRPSQARAISRALVVLAALIILLAVGAVWLAGPR